MKICLFLKYPSAHLSVNHSNQYQNQNGSQLTFLISQEAWSRAASCLDRHWAGSSFLLQLLALTPDSQNSSDSPCWAEPTPPWAGWPWAAAGAAPAPADWTRLVPGAGPAAADWEPLVAVASWAASPWWRWRCWAGWVSPRGLKAWPTECWTDPDPPSLGLEKGDAEIDCKTLQLTQHCLEY